MTKKLAVTAAACAALAGAPGEAAARTAAGGEACSTVVKWTFDRPLPSTFGTGTVSVDYDAQECVFAGATVDNSVGPVTTWVTPWGGPFTRRARTHTFKWRGTCAHADLEPLDDGGIMYRPSGWIKQGTVGQLSGDWVDYGTLRTVYEAHALAPNPRAGVELSSASSDEPPTCPARLVGVVAWTLPWLV